MNDLDNVDIRDPLTGTAFAVLVGLAPNDKKLLGFLSGIELQRSHPAVTAEFSRLFEQLATPELLAEARQIRDEMRRVIDASLAEVPE